MQSQNYDGSMSSNIARRAKKMDVHMNSAIFKPSGPIPISSLLYNFETACDGNDIHEWAAMSHFQHVMNDAVKAISAQRLCAKKEDEPQQGV